MVTMKKLSRRAVRKAAKAALAELAKERLKLYMEAYDEEPENWEGTTPKRVRSDVLEGTWRFLHPVLTDFYVSPMRDAYIKRGARL